MASSELTKLSTDLATQNGVTTPTPAPANESITDTYNRAAGVVNSDPAGIRGGDTTPVAPPPVLRNSRGGIDKPNNPSQINRPVTTPAVAAPQTTAQIQADLLKASQGEINAINQYASQQIEALKPTQDARLRETSSVNTLSGLAGSSEANVTTGATRATNDKENALVRAEAAAKIQSVMSGVKTKAITMAQTAKEQFRLDTAESRAQKLADTTEAVQHAATLAATGVTYDGLKASDPESYKYLADSVGGEAMLKAQFTLNRPQEDILDKKIENGKYVIAYRNPLTGATRIESVDLGLPPQYTKTVDAGNRILAIPDNWDGDPQNLITINKGLTPGQSVSGSNDTYGGYNEDQNKVITRVDDKISKNDTYKKTSNMRGYVDNVTGALALGTGTGDLAAINQFQKVIDEGAVTRDQDVKLIQNSQSLINKLKTKIKGLEEGDQLSLVSLEHLILIKLQGKLRFKRLTELSVLFQRIN
jgi:hypothetical protein